MVLIYSYIHQYKNFFRQEFNFHKDYKVRFSEAEETLDISYCGPDPIQKALFAEHHVDGLQLLVGKTGSGKTNLFQLLGELDEYRRGKQTEHPMFDRNSWAPHTQEGAYFFLYADVPGSYYIECKDMRLPQFEAIWSTNLQEEHEHCYYLNAELEKKLEEIRRLRGEIKKEKSLNHKRQLKKLYAQLEEKEEIVSRLSHLLQKEKKIRLFWSTAFSLDRGGSLVLDECRKLDTYILNCYDRNSFHIRPYPNLNRKSYQMGEWLQRLDLPYQQASLGGMCRYIRDITQFLARYEDKYFTPTTFEIPVEVLMGQAYARTSNDLFERIEQYRPDNSDLFDRDLLLYHFTHLSTGELQYARVFGLLSDYLNAPVQEGHDPRHYIILLDEPDANLHPELCRQFLSRLLDVCGTAKRGRTCQLLISTHSPFFLSDVTPANILRLGIDNQTGQGVSVPDTQTRYFGANIHDIKIQRRSDKI